MQNLEEIRKSVSLVALAEAAGAEFDSRLRSVCPLPGHKGDRSSRAFSIFDNERRWKCHSSCPSEANGGDVFTFYMAWKGVDFKTALAELAEHTSIAPMPLAKENVSRIELIPVPTTPDPVWRARAEQFIAWAEGNLASHAGAQEYLEKERGLSPETWRAFRLGYNPTNLYDDPARWGLTGKNIWLPRGLVIPGFAQKEPSYIKIRRPLPGQALGKYIGEWKAQDGLDDVKFGGPRGGVTCLFRLELIGHYPILVLTEGEWDAMLLWEYCSDLCDVGTLGGAGAKLDVLDLSILARYLAVLVIHDNDQAGENGREYILELHARFPRLQSIRLPAHDLTEFWLAGGCVRSWLAGQLSAALENALQGFDAIPKQWGQIARLARMEATLE